MTSFHHIPKEENQKADAILTLSFMFKTSPHRDLLCIESRFHIKSAHCCQIEEEEDGKPILISNDISRTESTHLGPLRMTRGHYGGWRLVPF